ncbi:baseplate J/gp47 family protein [Pyxidicoccus xibeiensis]|uniref:baseplate J/gp47 family protein n=1 Tax=Pyxidicoccus xibeiensis TaxID=2906759 RepID=UPI0020A7F817|nr:baseplate J/gp47 family protein [Pyxidicoccus xibeiensis]MCP3143390.1 baseplate J/gp47 family protein [Pyxidicoccus xibeiensis]
MLPELSLDTVTFSELVELGRRRIPALSRGAWTNHNAHDPGITLLELYAYLLEQRIFWLDGVSPSLERALLRLLGTAPEPARAARTVLTASVQGRAHLELEAGTKVDAGTELSPLTFTLDESIAVLACERIRLGGTAFRRPLGLPAGRAVALLPHHGGRAELVVELALRSPWRPDEHPVALLFELMTPAKVRPQWHPDSQEAPPPVRLEVHASTPAGLTRVAFEDGTGGLRRGGILRVHVPADWSAVGGLHRLVLSTEAATFSVPPRLVRLGINAVRASHRVSRVHTVREDWPRLPGRTLELEDPNGPPLPDGLSLVIGEGGSRRWRRWHEVDDLTHQGPADRVFTREGPVLRFGDGIHGRLPVLPRDGVRLRVRYQAGGGERGNLAAGHTFRFRRRRRLHLTNAVPAVGGRPDEPLAAARDRAAARREEITRAVLAADHEALAVTTPGVAIRRAFAVAGFHELHPMPAPGVVTVYVLPDAPRGEELEPAEPVDVPAPVVDPGALEAVRRHLEGARLVTGEIHVLPARYRAVRLAFRARARTPDPAGLRDRIHQALRTYLDPLVGGDDGKGWPFGGAIEPSALVRRAQVAVGADAVVSDCAAGLDGEPPRPACDAIVPGCHRLPHLVEVAVRVEPLVDAGGLQ